MREKEKNKFCAVDVQKEIDKNCKECFDILQNNEKHLQKFKEIYKEQFGVELTDKEALDCSIVLLNFVRLIVRLSKR